MIIMNEIILIKNELEKKGIDDSEILKALDIIEKRLDFAEKLERTLCDSRLYIVYKHTVPDGKVYIGITKNTPQTRWNEGEGYSTNKRFTKAIKTHGWVHIKHEILEAGLTEQEAKKLENTLIRKYKSYKKEFGYNNRVDLNAETVDTDAIDLKTNTALNEKQINDEPKFHEEERKIYKECIEYYIAKECIKELDVYAVGKKLYYFKENHYYCDDEKPFIQQYILDTYKINSNKLKEVVKQINILCLEKDPKDNIKIQGVLNNSKKPTDNIEIWIKEMNISEEYLLTYSTKDLYETYVDWCKKGNKNEKGKKVFYKAIKVKFNFTEKVIQKTDGKRYFNRNIF